MLFFHFFAQKFAKTAMFIIPLHRNSEKPPGATKASALPTMRRH